MNRLATLSMAMAMATAILCVGAPSHAQQDKIMETDAIVQGLLPPPADAPAKMSGIRKRGVEITGPATPRPEATAAAKIVLQVAFEHNSDQLTGPARQQLDALVKALNNNQLQQYSFEISGHTNMGGSAAYNQSLSQRRADSVVAYLTGHSVDSSRLRPVGKGFNELLNPGDPYAAGNRRVEVRTLLP